MTSKIGAVWGNRPGIKRLAVSTGAIDRIPSTISTFLPGRSFAT